MAGGKLTPRQKMINMMYLVLTALLAINVSAEILNAFKTVNNSITTSNRVISEQNKSVYEALEEAKKDPQTAAKANEWAPRAAKVKQLSDEMYNFIEGYKTKIKQMSDLKIENGEEVFKMDDLDASTLLFVEQKEGEKIYDKMKKYREDMLAVLAPTGAESPVVAEQLKKDVAAFQKSLPINLEVQKSKTGNSYPDNAKGWAMSNFNSTPTVATVTILSKLQNDVKNSEANMSEYCLQQLGKVKVVYDKFAAIASANTNYCMPGDPIEVSAGVGAFSDAAKPTVVINGSAQPLVDGMATFKTTAQGAGEHSIPVKISFVKPDGSIATVDKQIKYTVGTPAGSAVMLDKMNVFYIGVPNPVTVSSGTGDEKTLVSMSGGNLSKNAPGKYTVNVTTPGEATITVGSKDANSKSIPFKFRVKRIPDPIITAGGKLKGGKVQKGTLVAQQGLVALLENFDFEARYDVVSFEMNYVSKGEVFTKQGSGPMFTPEMKSMFQRAGVRDLYTIENVKVKGPDGQVRSIPGIAFQII